MAQHWATVCVLILALSAFVHYDIAFAARTRGVFPTKTGVCPLPLLQFGLCVELCATDYDCLGDDKCCRNACGGHQCKAPSAADMFEKVGRCPIINGPTTCGFQCYHDSECPGDEKCCRTCGSSCMDPVMT